MFFSFKAIRLIAIIDAEDKASATFEASLLRFMRRYAANLAHIVLYTVLLFSSKYIAVLSKNKRESQIKTNIPTFSCGLPYMMVLNALQRIDVIHITQSL